MKKILAFCVFLAIAGLFSVPAQNFPASPAASFQGGLNLGSDILPTGPAPDHALESWVHLGFTPDFAIGKFGIGLDLNIRFQLYHTPSQALRIYEGDWIPAPGKTVFDVYLPKLLYVRYGIRGVDPLYAKLGSIKDFTLGNGFIVGDYSNMRFLPETRLFGVQIGIDGSLVGFPYAGIEFLTGNLARFDVTGGRIFVRPFAETGIPIVRSMQFGLTGVADFNPYLYGTPDPIGDYPAAPSTVFVAGTDITVPLLASPLLTMNAFAEGALEPNAALGGTLGLGGRLFGIFTYDAQVRRMQAGFIPTYFDANYDLYRADRFRTMKNVVPGAFSTGWSAGLGTTLFKDKLYFKVAIDGPFAAIPSVPSALQTEYPHGKAVLGLMEGIIPGIFVDAYYEKYFIGRAKPFWGDLVDPTDAMIGLALNYRIGATVLTLNYDATWNPVISDFEIHSSLIASVKF